MCSLSSLNKITSCVVRAAKESLGDKLDKVILYGSYARGDFDDESDIDILVLADIPHENCWSAYMKISDLTWKLDLEYGVLISIHVTDCETFYRFSGDLPFYTNVIREGVELSA